MKWPFVFFASVAFAGDPRSAESLGAFFSAFARASLPSSEIQLLKAEDLAQAKIPEKPVESRHVVTFLHRVRNISRVYQLCVATPDTGGEPRVSLGKPDDTCQDELLSNFAKIKAGGLADKDLTELQGFLWAESEPAVTELEAKVKEWWKAGGISPASLQPAAAAASDPSAPGSSSPQP